MKADDLRMDPDADPAPDADGIDQMLRNAEEASRFLKAISHEGRLTILCHLSSGEKSVGELETLLGVRQAAVSQQLSRLRLEGLVSPRRDGKTIYYSLAGDRPRLIMDVLHEMFCKRTG
ncbi:MAG: metalloregulator ArsR/SmtB family transcription factor [Marinibacterium sp.]|nr:metalloregulator ArsR/SmtB family transcription factor [Marinibacterium sp.]